MKTAEKHGCPEPRRPWLSGGKTSVQQEMKGAWYDPKRKNKMKIEKEIKTNEEERNRLFQIRLLSLVVDHGGRKDHF